REELKARIKNPLRIKSNYDGEVNKVAVQRKHDGKARMNHYRIAVAGQEGTVFYWNAPDVTEKSSGLIDVPLITWPSGKLGNPNEMVFTTDGKKLLSFYNDGIRVSVLSAEDLKEQARQVLGAPQKKLSKAIWKGKGNPDPLVLKKRDTLVGAPF